MSSRYLSANEERRRVEFLATAIRMLAKTSPETAVRRRELFHHKLAGTTAKGPHWQFNVLKNMVRFGLVNRTSNNAADTRYWVANEESSGRLKKIADNPEMLLKLTRFGIVTPPDEPPDGSAEAVPHWDDLEDTVEIAESIHEAIEEAEAPKLDTLASEGDPGIDPDEKLDAVVKLCWATFQAVNTLQEQTQAHHALLSKLEKELETIIYG